MPYVNVPNDLSKIKTKVAFNLTKRQLVCFGGAALVGVPSYLLARRPRLFDALRGRAEKGRGRLKADKLPPRVDGGTQKPVELCEYFIKTYTDPG